jgi:molecular chaperone DnaK
VNSVHHVGSGLGVDFGTSITVAVIQHADGRTAPLLFDSSPLLSSAVFADPAGQLLVGRDAEQAMHHDPGSFEPNPKRRIDDSEVLLGRHVFPVATLIAAVLRRVHDEVVRILGGVGPSWVAVTHPASWGAARRQVLLDAAAEAGMPAPTLVSEPVAAALYYVSVLRSRILPNQGLLVYDLGGGTFDVAKRGRISTGRRPRSRNGTGASSGIRPGPRARHSPARRRPRFTYRKQHRTYG